MSIIDYIIDLKKSPAKFKKYRADVVIDGKIYKNVDFGDTRYKHYKDSTHLKLYSHLDHNDWNRKRAFLARHQYNVGPASLLAKAFLW